MVLCVMLVIVSANAYNLKDAGSKSISHVDSSWATGLCVCHPPCPAGECSTTLQIRDGVYSHAGLPRVPPSELIHLFRFGPLYGPL